MRFAVTPYAGVWIEIFFERLIGDFVQVTPYAGVWIEIRFKFDGCYECWSLPTRECGLKYNAYNNRSERTRHSLRGSVD